MQEYNPEEFKEVDNNPLRMAMVSRSASGRFAVIVRLSFGSPWIQVASRKEWPVAREEVNEYEGNIRLLEEAIERINLLNKSIGSSDWGVDGFIILKHISMK